MNKITVVGVGSGSYLHLTPEVKKEIDKANVLVLSSRFLHLASKNNKKIIILNDFNDTFEKIQKETGDILILVSGDAGLYSLLPLVKKFFIDKDIKVLPGLSSMQILCARAAENWNEAEILSGHGKELNIGFLLNTIERNEKIIVFCDKKNSPSNICNLIKNFDNIEVFIGSKLGAEDEIFIHGSPSNFFDKIFPEPAIILIKNRAVYSFNRLHLRDHDFLREKNIVMTNENVRAAILSRLEFGNNSIFWDIGAGSGSVSISAAYENISMNIHAIDKNPKSIDLITKNVEKFHLHNVQTHLGLASEIMKDLPVPTHIFIGGSGGELKKIFSLITKFNNNIRIVIACVTLENFHQAYELMKSMKDLEVTQISVTSSRQLNEKLTIMAANNPVMILSCNI